MLNNSVVLLPQMYHFLGKFWRGKLKLIEIINHYPKTLRIDIQKHPTIALPCQALVPSSAEDSLQPHPLYLGQGKTGYVHHDPPRVNIQNLRHVNIDPPVLG